MVIHAAFGGSTNLLLHIPAIAHAAGLRRPTASDWAEVNREVPRIVDALPNGPMGFATVQVFLAGGVPEVMLHLRGAGLLDCSVMTVTGCTLDENLNWWEQSHRRCRLKARLEELDGVNPDDVVLSADRARLRGLTPTICFPVGNLSPEGSVIKSTAIDSSLIDETNTYRHRGPARVFTTEAAAIEAIKLGTVQQGDVLVLICGGPLGAGMQETYQITAALKSLPHCKHVAVLTDARFSGVSTVRVSDPAASRWHAEIRLGSVGATIRDLRSQNGTFVNRSRTSQRILTDGDLIEIVIDRSALHGTVNFVGHTGEVLSHAEGARRLAARPSREDLAPHPALPDDTRLWAALVQASGGVWGGCVYDTDAIISILRTATTGCSQL